SVAGRLVGIGVEQLVQLRRIARLQAEEPAAVRLVVDQLRRIGELLVYGDDFAGYRRINVRRSLYRLHHAGLLTGLQLLAGFWQLDINHVTQRLLSVIGNPHTDATIGLQAGPFVAGGVTQIAGYVAHSSVLMAIGAGRANCHAKQWGEFIPVLCRGARTSVARRARDTTCCGSPLRHAPRFWPAHEPGRWTFQP